MKLSTRKNVVFAVCTPVLTIGLLEILLGLLAFVSPRVDSLLKEPILLRPWISDTRLGVRGNLAYPGHDRKGFRNVGVPAKAYLVALGDSQTWGTGVDSKDAWPKQLGSMIGETVYSMALPGYGPTQSLFLWDEVVGLSPEVVIEAFYVGNDLYDSFHHMYNRPLPPESIENKVQLAELKSSDPELEAGIRKAEQYGSIKKREEVLFGAHNSIPSPPRRFLSQHSNIYGLMRRAKVEIVRWLKARDKDNETPEKEWETEKAFAESHPACCEVFSDGHFKTVFTSGQRLLGLNLEDARIAEGLRVALRAMKRMHELAIASNTRFVVLLIPTKERVFQQIWHTPSMNYRSLIANEERTWSITKNFLAHNGIEYLDALPSLRGELAVGIQPYKISRDSHPNEYGHKAIAKLVAAFLKSSNTHPRA
jgi:lysophospholipase L1-like esterase